MDIRLDEGETTIRIVAKPTEIRDLYDELRRWNTASASPNVSRLLDVLKEAGHLE